MTMKGALLRAWGPAEQVLREPAGARRCQVRSDWACMGEGCYLLACCSDCSFLRRCSYGLPAVQTCRAREWLVR